MKTIFVLTIGCLITGCSITGKMPTLPDNPVAEAPLPSSSVGIPVNIDITPVLSQVNQGVPQQFRNNAFPNEDNDGHGNCFKYEVNRQPIDINGNGNRFDLSTSLHYWVEVHAKAVFDCFLWGTCGRDAGTYPRILNVGYQTNLDIQPNYFMKSQTTDPQINPGNDCRIMIFNINITDLIINAARGPLSQAKSQIDNYINNNSNFKPYAQTAWNELNKDIKLGDNLFLRMKPSGFYASGLNASGKNVGLTFGISAFPEIVTTASQNPQIPELPNLNVGGGANTFNIYFDIKSDYKFLSNELNNMFSNHRYSVPGEPNVYIDLQNVEVYGIGNSQVSFKFIGSGKIKFKKYKKTVFYINAKPVYDPASRSLTFTNVSIDTESNDLFLKAGLNLLNLPIVQGIQDLKIQVGNIIDQGVTTLTTSLNQRINDNITIAGNVNNLNGINLNPKLNLLIFRSHLSGNLNMTVTP